MSDFVEKKECRCCGGNDLYKFIDLGTQPLANSYTEVPEVLPEYPLAVNVCRDCWHTQLTHVVNPDLMFKNYLYVSGTSNTLKEWFSRNAYWMTKSLIRYDDRDPASIKVLDIACNDGSQLDAFKAIGCQTYGVDPAVNLVPEAFSKGHDVFQGFWGQEAVEYFSKEHPFDIITAQNVFAHTDDILSFLMNCKKVMNDKTKLHIMTSQRNMYKNGEFDTIYHEHLSFFCTKSMKTVVERAGLVLHHVYHDGIHGGSYIFEIRNAPLEFNGDGEPFSNVDVQLEFEALGNEWQGIAALNDLDTYIKFGERAKAVVGHFRHAVETFQKQGYDVVGYGAAAKGMTVLNFGQIKLNSIVDDNPLKQFRFTPGNEHVQTRILPTSSLQNRTKPLVVVPLAWNFFEEIQSKVDAMNITPRPKFIRYFPNIQIT